MTTQANESESPTTMGDDSKSSGQGPQVVTETGEDEDYPIERVDAVYRKLDLRIIPGMPHDMIPSLAFL